MNGTGIEQSVYERLGYGVDYPGFRSTGARDFSLL
jgi:hypothetical protein